MLVAFLVLAVVTIVTPGQDTALTIKNTLAGGKRAGVATAAGVVCGQLTWALAASLGVAGLLLASEPAFLTLRLAGAAYLVWLGGRALLSAVRGRAPAEREARPRGLRAAAAYRQGVISNLGNAKIAVFFTSLLPQFVDPDASPFPLLFVLGAVFAAMTLAWLSAYALVVARTSHVLSRPRVRRALDAVTGAVLVAFGARLALQKS